MRPIDLQDNFSKAPLASREQQIQQSAADFAQRSAAMEDDAERILNHSRPAPSEELDPAENRETDPPGDDGGGNRRDQSDGSGEDGSEPGDADAGEAHSGDSHIIDLVA